MIVKDKFLIHPYIRLFFLFSGITGFTFINNVLFLFVFYLLVILPLFAIGNIISKHVKLLIYGIFPVYLTFILLYIIVLGEGAIGWEFINLKILKLLLFTSTFQFVFSIPSNHLFCTLKAWRFKGDLLIAILGSLTVWEDILRRSDKIITARFSRGFVKKRTLRNKAKQLPFILVPLIIGILRTSSERADSWEQKKILDLIENMKPSKYIYPILINFFLIFVSTVCLVSVLFLNITY